MMVTLLVPALNEVNGMKAIMPRVNKEWCDQILVLDGGSTDGTLEYANEMGYETYVQKEEGLRKGYNEIYEMIRGDILITFSPDGNSIPELIPVLIAKIKEGHDMVIASRYAKGARSYDDDKITAFGNWMFTNLINAVYGARYTDAMVMYRAYKKSVIDELRLREDSAYAYVEKAFRTKISWEPLLSIRAAKKKLRCADIPGDEPSRIGGERKLLIIKWGLAYMTQVITEKFTWM